MMTFKAVSGMTYIDRGDPAIEDFYIDETWSFSAWTDLDLSAIVPLGVKAVYIRGKFKTGIAGCYFSLRKKGNTNVINSFKIHPIVGNYMPYFDTLITLDNNRMLQYYISSTSVLNLEFSVAGWFI